MSYSLNNAMFKFNIYAGNCQKRLGIMRQKKLFQELKKLWGNFAGL